jgi:hypothetical protein
MGHTNVTNERISFTSPFPTVLSIDGSERIQEFLARHGGAAPDVEHEGDRSEGAAGWSEVHAADGYRLHCEWSALGSERIMHFFEIAPELPTPIDPPRTSGN